MLSYPRFIFAALILSCMAVKAWASPSVETVNWHLHASTMLNLTYTEYTYLVEVKNTGADLENVAATLSSNSSRTQIVRGDASFGDVAAGENKTSLDYVVIKHNHWYKFDPSVIDVEFTTTSAPNGNSDDMFDPNKIIDIKVSMSEEDFKILRAEGRSLASAARECLEEYDYTTFKADVTIDGYVVPEVEIRKKGFLGSLTRVRPSLKFDFDEFVEDREFNEMSRMTLNNNRQDPSHVRQCLAYDMYRKAGIAAPRCNLARVTVNGEEMGIYTHVESIKKPFLKRTFGDKGGNLYESQLADFGTYLQDKFEKKTNEKENDRSDLAEVSNALALDDANFIAEVSTLVDIDEFIKFWAIDTLIGNWDSATGNANNYYIYDNPNDDLFHYIPWGTDLAFTGLHTFHPTSGPMYRNIQLASRLYAIDEYKNQYHQTLNTYLNTLWNETILLAEIDRVQSLTNAPDSAYDSLKRFILGSGQPGEDGFQLSQRDLLGLAMSGQLPPQQPHLIEDKPLDCTEPQKTRLTASVQSVWGLDTGSFSFTNRAGENISVSLLAASLGADPIEYSVDNATLPSTVSLLLVGVDLADNFKPYVVQVFIEQPDYTVGDHELHGLATSVMLINFDPNNPANITAEALSANGTISMKFIGGLNKGNMRMTLDTEMEFTSTGYLE